MDAPAPGPSSGRRGNGLPADAWGALVDLDPRLSEALLSSLAEAQVAAYVEPATGQVTWTRASELPARPLDRLWVDPRRADAARAVVVAEVADLTALLAEREPGATAHGLVQAVPRSAAARVLEPPALPGPPARRSPSDLRQPGAGPAVRATDPPPAPTDPDDTDEVWRQIVAGFSSETAPGPVPPWPVDEDVEPPRGRTWTSRPERAGDDAPRRRRTDRPAAETDPAAPLPGWVEPEALEDDGHYVPPPPPPVPRLAPQKLAAAVTLLAGLLLMFAPGLLLQPRTAGVVMFGALLTVGGAGALVWLMRDAPPNAGPDDGAVV
jgi:hypothetical protein